MNDHKEVEGAHHPELRRFVVESDEPKEKSDHRNVEEHKGAAGVFVRHGAQNIEKTPLVLVHGVEFMREQRRKREVEEEVEQRSSYSVMSVMWGVTLPLRCLDATP